LDGGHPNRVKLMPNPVEEFFARALQIMAIEDRSITE
jgi:hypothetical protein